MLVTERGRERSTWAGWNCACMLKIKPSGFVDTVIWCDTHIYFSYVGGDFFFKAFIFWKHYFCHVYTWLKMVSVKEDFILLLPGSWAIPSPKHFKHSSWGFGDDLGSSKPHTTWLVVKNTQGRLFSPHHPGVSWHFPGTRAGLFLVHPLNEHVALVNPSFNRDLLFASLLSCIQSFVSFYLNPLQYENWHSVYLGLTSASGQKPTYVLCSSS